MKLSDLTSLPLSGGADTVITGLTADSREVKPGFLFAALPGNKVDGRDYVDKAINNGAVAILAPTGTKALGAVMVQSDEPRRELAYMAARFYPLQPHTIIAITGTNGKSSTVEFLRQIWHTAGREAACLGTLGVTKTDGFYPLHHTTPDPVSLHQEIHKLAKAGVEFLALEASSHGLMQNRLDGVNITHTGFTNLSQDHFDYHQGFEDYFAAKALLFDDLAAPGSPVSVLVDGQWGQRMAALCAKRGLKVLRVGWEGEDVRLREVHPLAKSQTLTMEIDGELHAVELPLAGEFQALNAVLALGLALQSGVELSVALEALAQLKGVRGRMEPVGSVPNGAPIFVDFAHTPDGLDKLLRALRPHTKGDIHLVFGCGGDRDPSKRPKMGKIAAQLADHIVVTDDNPRHEDPPKIRQAILQQCTGAREIADRKAAIIFAAKALKPGDALVIAGKGHENGQIIGDVCVPFNDAKIARGVIAAMEAAND